MKLEVYIDLVFAVNVAMDFLLLWLMSKMTKRTALVLRLFVASILGGLFACMGLIVVDLRTGLKSIVFTFFVCAIMMCVAFSYKSVRILLRDLCIYYGITFLVGGILNYIYYYTKAGYYITEFIRYLPSDAFSFLYLLFYVGIAIGFIAVLKKIIDKIRKEKEQFYDVSFVFEQNKTTCRGFLDTGNQLYDPITRKPVLLVELDEIIEILPKPLVRYCKEFTVLEDEEEQYKRYVKVIPYHAVGTSEGILPAIVFSEVSIVVGGDVKRYENMTVAIYKGSFSSDKSYHVILHEKLL